MRSETVLEGEMRMRCWVVGQQEVRDMVRSCTAASPAPEMRTMATLT